MTRCIHAQNRRALPLHTQQTHTHTRTLRRTTFSYFSNSYKRSVFGGFTGQHVQIYFLIKCQQLLVVQSPLTGCKMCGANGLLYF